MTIDKTDTTHTIAPDHRAEKTSTMTDKSHHLETDSMKEKEAKIDLDKSHHLETDSTKEIEANIDLKEITENTKETTTHTKPETIHIREMTTDTRKATIETEVSREKDHLTDTKEVERTLETEIDTHQYHPSLRAL